jgi:hypothetical protein
MPVHLAVATGQQSDRHRGRIVPPDFSRDTVEKLKRLHHAFQNRLGAFGWQRDRKRRVGVRPDQNQHRNLSPPVGKIDIDLAEVGFQPLAGIVIQWDKRLAFFGPLLVHEPTNRVVTTPVGVFIAKPLEDPHRSMPLLRRLRLVLRENLQNPIVKRSQLGSRLRLPPRVTSRFPCALQDLADLLPRMMKPPSDLSNAHPIAMSTPYPSVIVHRKHPSPRN